MRLKELTIYSQYFRFLLEDDRVITGNYPYKPVIAAVTYDNERQTVACTCSNDVPCEHKVFIHEIIDKEKDDSLWRLLNDYREESAQTITPETLNRIRGAFAREYNLAKGVVQYPARREPLGWEGRAPGILAPMRVIQFAQRTPETFAVYELGGDEWKTVIGIANPECQNEGCKKRKKPCRHEQAVKEAVRTWREQGLLPKSEILGKTADTVIMDDLTMVEKAEPVSRTGKAEGGWITVPPGFNGTYTVGFNLAARGYNNANVNDAMTTGLNALVKNARDQIEQAAREEARRAWESAIWGVGSASTAADVTFDSAKFEEDMKKAKKLLEKKEEPKPEKPAKPRTRFTDLEL